MVLDRPVVSCPVSAPLLLRSSSSSPPILRGTRLCDIDFFIACIGRGWVLLRVPDPVLKGQLSTCSKKLAGCRCYLMFSKREECHVKDDALSRELPHSAIPTPQTTPPPATSKGLPFKQNKYTTKNKTLANRPQCSPNTSPPSPRPSRPSTPNPARRRATSSPCCRPMRAPPWRSTSRSSARRRNHCPLRWRSSSVRARLYCKTTQSTSTDCMTFTEDGKEMSIDLEKMKIRDIQTEVDRHSRQLLRQEELNG